MRYGLGMRLPFTPAALILAVFLSACGGGETAPSGAVTTVLHPGAAPLPGESTCTVTEVTEIPVSGAAHVATCTAVTYATNPPSGGDHWPIWAAFRKYDTPIPAEMLVHDLEHGSVALLFRCDGACPEVVAALDAVFDAITDDGCPSGGPASRMVRAPDPDLPTPIAAAAWGATYTATCIDAASLLAFTKAHYRKGPEDTCADGVDVSSAAACGL
jgi:hypothetical protein